MRRSGRPTFRNAANWTSPSARVTMEERVRSVAPSVPPRPLAPWQAAQYVVKTVRPRATAAGSGVACAGAGAAGAGAWPDSPALTPATIRTTRANARLGDTPPHVLLPHVPRPTRNNSKGGLTLV